MSKQREREKKKSDKIAFNHHEYRMKKSSITLLYRTIFKYHKQSFSEQKLGFSLCQFRETECNRTQFTKVYLKGKKNTPTIERATKGNQMFHKSEGKVIFQMTYAQFSVDRTLAALARIRLLLLLMPSSSSSSSFRWFLLFVILCVICQFFICKALWFLI